MTYLGIDLGTSGIKALLIDSDQRIIGSATSELSVSRPASGWSEQDPAHWIAAAKAAMARLRRSHRAELGALRGIGLSGQMHGATLLGADDEVLRPCMLWNDTRSHEEAATLDGKSQFRSLTGNIVFPGFTAAKVEWVRRHEPDIFARIARIVLPKDYLRLWLAGEYFSDMSDASGTSWLDVAARDWSDELLGACGLRRSQMPALVEGNGHGGGLRAELASGWGARANVVIAGGGGDNAASAVGMGTVEPGDSFVSLGTSGVLFAATDSFLPMPSSAVHAFCHALPGMWHQMGVILSATDALNWYAGLVDADPGKLIEEIGKFELEPSPVLFLPYLSGERTPHNDARIRGAFMGLGHASDRRELTRAVLEGVAFALRDNLAALQAAGTRLESVLAVGGGSRSRYWLELIATVLGIAVRLPAQGDHGAAFGAARLGLLAAENGDWRDICYQPEIEVQIDPRPELAESYRESYAKYRAFYEQIREL